MQFLIYGIIESLGEIFSKVTNSSSLKKLLSCYSECISNVVIGGFRWKQ